MKNCCIILLACIALLGAGCTQGNVPEDLSRLEGLWGLTTDKVSPADGRYEEYIRFYADYSFEYYYITSATYVYHVGVYSISKGELTLNYKGLRRFDVVEDLPRLTDSYFSPNSLEQGVMTILDYSTDRMLFRAGSTKCYLFPASQIYGWNDEFSAADVPVIEEAFIAQWDQLDFYQYSWQGSIWWYFYEPEKNGITFADHGIITDCPFWANRVLEKMINAGKLTTSEQVEVNPDDCGWSLSADTLSMTCSRYLAFTPDAAGNRTAEHTETPELPVTIRFLVQTLTPYYLVLYNAETSLFHAFYRHKSDTPAADAPATHARPHSDALWHSEAHTMLDCPLVGCHPSLSDR